MTETKPTTVTISEAAHRLGVTRQAIGQWIKRPGAPVLTTGGTTKVLWPSFIRWREAELISTATRQADAPDLLAAQLRKANADARKAELQAAQLEGEVAPIADMDKAVERLASAVRAEVLGLRSRFVGRIVGLTTPAEAAAVLDAMQDQILAALRDRAEAIEAEDDADADAK